MQIQSVHIRPLPQPFSASSNTDSYAVFTLPAHILYTDKADLHLCNFQNSVSFLVNCSNQRNDTFSCYTAIHPENTNQIKEAYQYLLGRTFKKFCIQAVTSRRLLVFNAFKRRYQFTHIYQIQTILIACRDPVLL